MPLDGRDSLHLAQYLAGTIYGPCTPESMERAVVSRAYYAAYGHAFYHEIPLGFVPETDRRYKGSNHRLLMNWFRNKRTRTSTQIATELEELRGWRESCDYDKTIYVSLPIISILKKAENIVSSLI